MEQRLLDRIRALLAKAEATNYPDEADTYTAKAAELIAKYGINQAMLAAAGGRRDAIDQQRIDIDNPYSTDKARLLGAIARALRCRVVNWGTPRKTAYCILVGYESDRERVELLYTSLLLQAVGQLTRVRPPAVNSWSWDGPSAAEIARHRRSWFIGFTAAARQRLQAIEAHAAAQADTSSGTPGTALVLADRRTQVERYFDEQYPDLDAGRKSKATLDPDAYHAGHQAGQRADLGQTRVSNDEQAALR